MLAPNKQTLILLGKQKKLISNGHKLLKEKRSGLIYTFLDFSRQGKDLEKQFQNQLNSILKSYQRNLTFLDLQTLKDNLPSVPSTIISVRKKRVSGVYLDSIQAKIKKPVRSNLKTDIQFQLSIFADFLPKLLELSQLKVNCNRIAKEIQKVGRQISNLERKIDEVDSQIKYIKNVLTEKSNLEKATLIKIFN